MKKKVYLSLEFDIVRFDAEDIITDSQQYSLEEDELPPMKP